MYIAPLFLLLRVFLSFLGLHALFIEINAYLVSQKLPHVRCIILRTTFSNGLVAILYVYNKNGRARFRESPPIARSTIVLFFSFSLTRLVLSRRSRGLDRIFRVCRCVLYPNALFVQFIILRVMNQLPDKQSSSYVNNL